VEINLACKKQHGEPGSEKAQLSKDMEAVAIADLVQRCREEHIKRAQSFPL
jgi:hypothetical protein